MHVLRLRSTFASDVDAVDPVVVDAKGYPWTARIVADTPVHVEIDIDAIADTDSAYVNEFEQMLFSVSADEDVSILGTDNGKVWVSEVGHAYA